LLGELRSGTSARDWSDIEKLFEEPELNSIDRSADDGCTEDVDDIRQCAIFTNEISKFCSQS